MEVDGGGNVLDDLALDPLYVDVLFVPVVLVLCEGGALGRGEVGEDVGAVVEQGFGALGVALALPLDELLVLRQVGG